MILKFKKTELETRSRRVSKLTALALPLFASALLGACSSTSTKLADLVDYAPPQNVPYAADARSNNAQMANYTQSASLRGSSKSTSLWTSSPQSLFGDRRASQLGDILTVMIEIDDEAEISNSANQNRQSDENFGLNAFFGLPQLINKKLPDGASVTPAIDVSRGSNVSGNGTIKREEKMTLRLAAQVVGVMPNGYLQLQGQQQIMVNNEVRHLQVSGLVRTQDISRLNIITYDKMADARIYYGGKGQVSNTVKVPSGNRFLQKAVPF